MMVGEETHWNSFGNWIIFSYQELNNNKTIFKIMDHKLLIFLSFSFS